MIAKLPQWGLIFFCFLGALARGEDSGHGRPIDLLQWLEGEKIPAIVLVAHRGGVVEKGAPECSLEAIRRAQRDGFHMVELDIRCAKDGIPIVFHDPTMLTDCGDPRAISDVKARQLIKMGYSGTDQKIVSAEDALRLCKDLGLGVQLDFKDRRDDPVMGCMVARVAELLVALELTRSTVTISNGRPIIDDALTGKAIFKMSMGEFSGRAGGGESIPTNRYVFGHGSKLTDPLVAKMMTAGVPIMPSINTFHYLVDSDYARGGADIRRLRALGVRWFQIDSGYLPYLQDTALR